MDWQTQPESADWPRWPVNVQSVALCTGGCPSRIKVANMVVTNQMCTMIRGVQMYSKLKMDKALIPNLHGHRRLMQGGATIYALNMSALSSALDDMSYSVFSTLFSILYSDPNVGDDPTNDGSADVDVSPLLLSLNAVLDYSAGEAAALSSLTQSWASGNDPYRLNDTYLDPDSYINSVASAQAEVDAANAALQTALLQHASAANISNLTAALAQAEQQLTAASVPITIPFASDPSMAYILVTIAVAMSDDQASLLQRLIQGDDIALQPMGLIGAVFPPTISFTPSNTSLLNMTTTVGTTNVSMIVNATSAPYVSSNPSTAFFLLAGVNTSNAAQPLGSVNTGILARVSGCGALNLTLAACLNNTATSNSSTPPPTSASSTGVSRAAASSTAAATSAVSGWLCYLSYALPGNVDFPWSQATTLQFSYNPTPVTTSAGTGVAVIGGTGSRTFTNRFGVSFTSPLTVSLQGSSLLYLHSTYPVDASGLTWTLSSPVQLPGQSPSHPYTQLTVYNASGVVQEGQSSRVDGLSVAFLSNVPGFTNTSIAASNINSLAVSYTACQAPLTFTNGLRPPTQPSNFNGGRNIRYSFYVSDGATYSVVVNLTLTASSPFATTADQLGNPYQSIINATGTRVYTHLPTGQTLISTVLGLSSSGVASTAPRLYPYSLLASAPGVYSGSTAPWFDADGLSLTISPAVPVNGAPVQQAPLSSTTAFYQSSSLGGLVEGAPLHPPLLSLQQQSYVFG